uniref:SMP-LTD domain-containing protein n=1 Tax=Petromyzon marinus TaxID=7757 RepID=S4R4S0_PETMA
MNEVDAYDPETFHSSALRGVRVELRGATLSLSRTAPGTKDPEPCGSGGSSSRTRMLDIAGCTLSLAPARLAEKRTWSKKYPIVLALRGAASAGAEGVRSGAARVAGSEGGAALFLFGRTGREKEEWFQRFLHASQGADGDHAESHERSKEHGWLPISTVGYEVQHTYKPSKHTVTVLYQRPRERRRWATGPAQLRAIHEELHPRGRPQSPPRSVRQPGLREPGAITRVIVTVIPVKVGGEVACINALIGRVLWDALTSEQWAQLISSKIQQKLGKIRLPPLLDALELTELDMGKDALRILRAFPPTLDAQGLWVELDVSYSGSFEMTLETKLNLSKLGKEEAEGGRAAQDLGRRRRSRVKTIEDSEDESSAESSLDGDDGGGGGDGTEAVPGGQAERTGYKKSKLKGLLGRLARSDCLRRAAENPLVRRTVAGVSNTPLALTVAVHRCWGTLALNVPPPPSDRIWYGFREPPHLGLRVHPKLGERHVTLAHITDWIEKKLEVEFENNFVIPNMDDLQIPMMHPATDALHSLESSSLPRPPWGTPSEFP